MTDTNVHKDTAALTMAITAELDADTDQVWKLWADPRLLERWWGPPTYPATFVEHDLSAGGTVTYFMTSPEGERYHGLWRVLEVDPPKHLLVEDAFADSDGNANTDLPLTTMQVSIVDRAGGGTAMTIVSTFASLEAMNQVLEMGMEQGMVEAMGQIDSLLAGAS
jgi:uncharacterized protein YndB with AHSA1/START domain